MIKSKNYFDDALVFLVIMSVNRLLALFLNGKGCRQSNESVATCYEEIFCLDRAGGRRNGQLASNLCAWFGHHANDQAVERVRDVAGIF